jgi:hypothetical protein
MTEPRTRKPLRQDQILYFDPTRRLRC